MSGPFDQSLVRALFSEFDEPMGKESEADRFYRTPDKKEMWMDPEDAVTMLCYINCNYEQRKDLIDNIKWE